MGEPLKLLLLEDNPFDAELLVRQLNRDGYECVWSRVDNEADFRREIRSAHDLVLADYHLPRYDAIRALDAVQREAPGLPVIVVTGMLDDRDAMECARHGAVDYLLKDRLGRLAPAVEQALHQKRRGADEGTRTLRRSIRVLVLEDSKEDTDLELRHLRDFGFQCDWQRVETELEFRRALDQDWDVILADYHLPQFDAFAALKLVQEKDSAVPFIMVTGVLDDEGAARCIKAGAVDYLLKDRIARIGLAVQRAIQDSGLQKQKKDALEALRTSEERFRLLAENAQDTVWLLRLAPVPRFEYLSPACIQLTGYPPQAFYDDGKLMYRLLGPENVAVFEDLLLRPDRIPSINVAGIIHRDGSLRWVEQRITPVRDSQNVVTAVQGISRDITERVKHEQELRALVEQRETLLRELHHRVKNNLQVLTSLLNLQITRSEGRAAEVLRDAQGRVRAMGIVHEQLHKHQSMDRVDLAEYLQTLTSGVLQSFEDERITIKASVNIQPIEIPIETAIPCGLIVNELLTNSVKHAFPGRPNGDVSVAVEPMNDGRLQLTVADNGIGLPADLQVQNLPSVGMRVVFRLLNQLGATYQIDRTGGTTWRIQFRVPQ